MTSAHDDSFAPRFDRALRENAMSLRSLQRELLGLGHSVGLSTLSYWRSGERLPERQDSMAALRGVESILALPPGTLRSSLGPSRRTGPLDLAKLDALAQRPGALSPMRSGLDLTTNPELAERSTQQIVELDEQGRVFRVRHRSTWRSRRDGARLFGCFFVGETSSTFDQPEVKTTSNCAVSAIEFDRSKNLMLTEFATPRALDLNDTVITEHELVGPWATEPEPEWQVLAQQRMAECLLWIRFDPRCVPRRSYEIVTDRNGQQKERPAKVVNGQLHSVRWQFGPGAHGFRWDF